MILGLSRSTSDLEMFSNPNVSSFGDRGIIEISGRSGSGLGFSALDFMSGFDLRNTFLSGRSFNLGSSGSVGFSSLGFVGSD